MYPFTKILVGLDMTEKDEEVIRYTAFLARFIDCKNIFFQHVTPVHEIPEEIREQYPELARPTDDQLRVEVKSKVEPHFDKSCMEEMLYYIREGQPVIQMLKTVKHTDIDLVITGRKAYNEEAVATASALSRKVPCSVLIVPMGSEPKISRIIVPIDFSEHSRLAIETALQWANKIKQNTSILLFHVYSIPTGYAKTGKTYNEFAEIVKNNALKQYEEFMADIDTGDIPVEVEFTLSDEVVEKILDKAHSAKCDLIIVGARGRSATAALLLGSFTEKLIHKSRLPLLAVKKKDENMGLLDAILSL